MTDPQQPDDPTDAQKQVAAGEPTEAMPTQFDPSEATQAMPTQSEPGEDTQAMPTQAGDPSDADTPTAAIGAPGWLGGQSTVALPTQPAVPEQPTGAMSAPELPAAPTELLGATPIEATGDAAGSAAGERTVPPTGGGIGALFRKHPKAWLASALGLAFVLLGGGAVFAGMASSAPDDTTVAAPTSTPTPTETIKPTRPVPNPIAAPTALRTCTLGNLATDPNLASLHASVLNATTGEVLFDRNAATPERTGSVLKAVTAAAALAALGSDYRITTRVVAGADPTTITLVGGGDATLSQRGPGAESFYTGAPKLSDLAAQVKAALPADQTDVALVLDATLWDPTDKWDSSWDRDQQTIGYMSEVTALQVDADRADPNKNTSPRSTDPIGRAGEAFAVALAAEGLTVTGTTSGAAPDDATAIAQVQSQPVSTLIRQMMDLSDNTLAEMLARLVSIEQGLPGTFGSLQDAYASALSIYGIPTTGMVIRDGSGLSEHNRVTPVYVAQLMAKALHGEQNLKLMYDTLPVAGQSGTLKSRFTGDAAVARGAVNAKTGWIDTARTLAGIVHAADGSQLAFAFYAVGTGKEAAMPALDALAAGAYRCGNNLSNN
ncbi:MAG: D-alanyl-D-alanine carboxypeptidase/D-alanyl-D-alanine-endopeptidase [Microbacteriaceae bacterium]